MCCYLFVLPASFSELTVRFILLLRLARPLLARVLRPPHCPPPPLARHPPPYPRALLAAVVDVVRLLISTPTSQAWRGGGTRVRAAVVLGSARVVLGSVRHGVAVTVI